MDALIIKKPYLDAILNGQKTWELRGSATHKRGRIALIESKSKTVTGVAEITDCHALNLETFLQSKARHCSTLTKLPYTRTYAWELANATRLPHPVPYTHPCGAIIWVKLPFEI